MPSNTAILYLLALTASFLISSHEVAGFEQATWSIQKASRFQMRCSMKRSGGRLEAATAVTAAYGGSVASQVQGASTVDELLRAAEQLVPPGQETVHWQTQLHHRKKRQAVSGRILAKLAKLTVGIANEPTRRHIAASPSLLRCLQSLDLFNKDLEEVDDDDDRRSLDASFGKKSETPTEPSKRVDASVGVGFVEEYDNGKEDDPTALRSALIAIALLIPTTTMTTTTTTATVVGATAVASDQVSAAGSEEKESVARGVEAMKAKAVCLADILAGRMSSNLSTSRALRGAVTMVTPEDHDVLWACQRLGIISSSSDTSTSSSGTTSSRSRNSCGDGNKDGSSSSSGGGGGNYVADATTISNNAVLEAGGGGEGERGLPFQVICGESALFSSLPPLTMPPRPTKKEEKKKKKKTATPTTPMAMPTSTTTTAMSATTTTAMLAELEAEVPFQEESLVTSRGFKVVERRKTCWMGDPGVGGFAYSGKVMTPVPWTPFVRRLRDALAKPPHTLQPQAMQPLDNNDDDNPCSRSCDPSDTWKGFEEKRSGGGIGSSSSSGGSGGNDGSSGSGGMGVDGGGGGGGVGVYYDCALLNWYGEGGESACAWHSDPEVGSYWQADSTIVSLGETRRFAFREIGNQEYAGGNSGRRSSSSGASSGDRNSGSSGSGGNGGSRGGGGRQGGSAHKGKAKRIHSSSSSSRSPPSSAHQQQPQQHSRTYQFYVFDGSCVRMFGDCQERFEHCVLPAEHGSSSSNRGARASIVFKSSMLTPSGRRGHGVAAVSVSTAPPPSSLRPTRGQKNPDGTAEEACSNRRAVAAGPPPSDEKRTKRRKPKVVSPPPTPQRPKRRGRP